jgi:hypothetical protein
VNAKPQCSIQIAAEPFARRQFGERCYPAAFGDIALLLGDAALFLG